MDAGLLQSFSIHLRSERKSPNTQNIYLLAARLLARWGAAHLDHSLLDITRSEVKEYIVWMNEEARKRNGQPFSDGYVNNQFRAIQAFFKWLVAEEDIKNPMEGLTPPKVGEKVVPIVEDDQIDALLNKYEKKNDFDSRRNYAVIRCFLYSGVRLSELTNIEVADVSLENATIRVVGKGNKERIVKIDMRTVKALDRYLRTRRAHKMAKLDALWLGSNHRPPLLPNGIRQCLRKAAQGIGFHLYPHKFRHNFAHRWLDAGGSEGDLMELMGWRSPQMLRRYGASARSARARRAYDRINLMDGR